MTEHDDDSIQPSSEPERPSRGGQRAVRWLRRGLVLLGVGLAFLLIVAIGVRLYFNDERLRKMVERTGSEQLGVELTLGELNLSLFSGLILENLVVGPPSGFEADVARVGRIELRYRLWALLGGTVHVEELSARDIELTQERVAEGGTNVEAILAHLNRNAEAAPPPEPPGTAPEPPPNADPLPALPELPLAIQVDEVHLGPVAAQLLEPDRSVRLSGYRLDAQFLGSGDKYALKVWTGLGEKDTATAGDSRLTLNRDGKLALSSTQRLSVDFDFEGYHSIGLALRWEALSDAQDPIDAPPMKSRAALAIHADLLASKVEMSNLRLSLGEETELHAVASSTRLFGDPTLRVETLSLTSVLDELEPLIKAAQPAAAAGGALEARLTPTEVTLSEASDLSRLRTGLTVKLDRVRGAFGAQRLRDLDGTIELAVADDSLSASSALTLGLAAGGPLELNDAELDLEMSSALSRWRAAPDAPFDAEETLEARGTLEIGRVSTPDAELDALSTELQLTGPVDVIRGSPKATAPLRLVFGQKIGTIKSGGVRLNGLGFRTTTSLFDLGGNSVDSVANLTIASTQSRLQPNALVKLPKLTGALELHRRGQRVRAPRIALKVGEFSLDGKLDADRVLSGAPKVNSAELQMTPFEVERALALVPKSMRPAQTLKGTVGLDAELQGTFPIAKLTRATKPPVLGSTVPAMARGVSEFLERLASLFEAGLPFTGHFGLELNDGFFQDPVTDVQGLSVDLDLNVLKTGPRFELAMLLGQVSKPQSVSDLTLRAALGFDGRVMESEGLFELGRYAGAGVSAPLREASAEWRMNYPVGGALALEKLEILAPDRDGRLYSSFVIQEPLKVVEEQRYVYRGMPGVDVAARFETNLRVDDRAPLSIPGLTLDGAFGMNGELRIEEGIIDMAGLAFTDRLSVENEAAVVTNIDGGIPFELRFATMDQEGFVPMPQPVLFGDGTLRIQVKRSVRLASARPLYYQRIRRYRSGGGIKIRKIESRGFVIEHLELDGGLRDAAIVAERARLSILGGDITGSMSIGISGKAAVAGTMDMKISNIDASTFGALDLEPGSDSEVDADATIRFAFERDRRDLTANMNVTRISSTALDRFLRLLDPDELNPAIQSTRFWLNLAQINGVAMWLAYENLNMDLDANSIIKVPFTSVGFPSFERELLRREPMGERLDIMLDPIVERVFGPLIGIRRGR